MKILHGACLVVHLIHRKRSPFPRGEGINYRLEFTKYQGKIRSAYRYFIWLLSSVDVGSLKNELKPELMGAMAPVSSG